MTPLAIQTRELLRRAILTLAAVPADRGPKQFGNPLGHMIVRLVVESYGYTPPAAVRFEATPRDVSIYLDVLKWLTWYEREVDRRMARLFVAWAFDTPFWMLAREHKRSEDTIRRWRDGVAVSIAHKFSAEIEKLGIDICGEQAATPRYPEYDGDLRPEVGSDLPSSPKAWRDLSEKVLSLPDSEARRKTIKKLRQNAAKAKKVSRSPA